MAVSFGPDQHGISRWSAEFVDPQVEAAFRLRARREARIQNRITLVIVGTVFAALGVVDYSAHGISSAFPYQTALRAVLAAWFAAVFVLLGRGLSPRAADGIVLSAQLLIVLCWMGTVVLYPPDVLAEFATPNAMGVALLALGQYVFVSTRLCFSLLGGLVTTAAYLGVNAVAGPASAQDLAIQGGLLAALNVIGLLATHRHNWLRRRQFAHVQQLREVTRLLREQGGEMQALNRDLAQARDEAMQANRAKSEFLAYMSHELRSPLNAIIGFSEVMKRNLFGPLQPEKYQDYVEDIHGSGTHLLAVINDLLDLSKAEAGRLELREETFALGEAFDAVARLIRERAGHAGVALRIEVEQDAPLLRADERMVRQMVLNLLTNAIAYTPKGGSVTLRAATTGDRGLDVAVADTGVGIAEADLPRIMEPYGQAGTARDSRVQGTGLGLPLVSRMMEVHGGTLEVDSAPGAGSTFTLRFPAARTVATVAA